MEKHKMIIEKEKALHSVTAVKKKSAKRNGRDYLRII